MHAFVSCKTLGGYFSVQRKAGHFSELLNFEEIMLRLISFFFFFSQSACRVLSSVYAASFYCVLLLPYLKVNITPRHEDNLVEWHLRQSLGKVDGKEHACFRCQVWHKGNMRIWFALTEDAWIGLYVGDRVALTDGFNIAIYSGLLNSKITFSKKSVFFFFSSDSNPLSLWSR